MQWLIDLVIEAIGVPPCYIRNPDFPGLFIPPGDWIKDGNFHIADVSAVVDAEATAIDVAWKYKADAAAGVLYIKPVGHVGFVNTCVARTYVANLEHNEDLTIPLDSNKQFEYRFSAGLVWFTAFRIHGWWL